MALYKQKEKRTRLRFSYTMELNFTSEDTKKLFLSRVESAKQRLAPNIPGTPFQGTCKVRNGFT